MLVLPGRYIELLKLPLHDLNVLVRLIELLLAVVLVHLLSRIEAKLSLQLNGSPSSFATWLQEMNASTLVSYLKNNIV